MDIKIILKKRLFRFLKENESYVKFIENFRGKFSYFETVDDLISFTMNDMFFCRSEINAFSWMLSKEGYKYWDIICKKWGKEKIKIRELNILDKKNRNEICL